MELTETKLIKISKLQKETLKTLHKKYKINSSKFIRDAINEKLKREKESLFLRHKEVQDYLKRINECPF